VTLLSEVGSLDEAVMLKALEAARRILDTFTQAKGGPNPTLENMIDVAIELYRSQKETQ
jgi:hypothetical protein